MGNGLFASQGETWLRQRRLVQPIFHREAIAGYGQIMTAYTQQMLADWQAGQVRDIGADMMRLTLRVICKICFDFETKQHVDRLDEAFSFIMTSVDMNLSQILIKRLESTSLGQGLVRSVRKAKASWQGKATPLTTEQALDQLDEIVFAVINERRADKTAADKNDLLSLLMRAQDEDGTYMTDQQLHDEVLTFILAGHETTALALTWSWYLLAKYPAVAEKLWHELEIVLGGRTPTVSDLPKLTYTTQIAKEVLRLYPSAWLFPRKPKADLSVADYTFSPKDTLLINVWAMHRDPRYYAAPNEFRPERWTEEMVKKLPKFAYMPFGGGPHLCVGQHFALQEICLVLATIAQQYKLELATKKAVQPSASMALRPKSAVKLLISSR